MPFSTYRLPRLLISVRQPDEAAAAVEGGADIVDVKAPERGSLGRPDIETVQGVVSALSQSLFRGECSVALGDAAEFDPALIDEYSLHGVTDLKLGTAGISAESLMQLDLPGPSAVRPGVLPPRIMLVAYADAATAAAPCIADVIQAAARLELAGLLIDTFDKSSGSLFDILGVDDLIEHRRLTHRCGLTFALAGRLTLDSTTNLAIVRPDIVGIRSAACRDGERLQTVCSDAVGRFRSALSDACLPAGA